MAKIFIGNIKGEAGTGLKILEHYETETELTSSVSDCEVGDAYSVGTETPYDIYVYSATRGFVNHGPLLAATVSDFEKLRADIDYIAGMTGVELQ